MTAEDIRCVAQGQIEGIAGDSDKAQIVWNGLGGPI